MNIYISGACANKTGIFLKSKRARTMSKFLAYSKSLLTIFECYIRSIYIPYIHSNLNNSMKAESIKLNVVNTDVRMYV